MLVACQKVLDFKGGPCFADALGNPERIPIETKIMRPEDYVYNVRPDGTASYLELNLQTPHLSSRSRGWEGIIVERDRFFPFDNGDVVYEEHFIGFVLDHGVHLSHAVDGHRYEGIYGPGDLILSPGQQPVNWRLDDASDALVVSIRPEVLRRLVQETTDADPARVRIIGQPRMRDPLISQIGMARTSELEGPGIGERLYVDSLLNVLSLHLLRHYSTLSRRPEPPMGAGTLGAEAAAGDRRHPRSPGDGDLADRTGRGDGG